MIKQTIEVEVPEGWKAKEYRMPNKGDYFWHQNRVCVAASSFIDQRLIIEKIQPRRIVLEETGEVRKLNFKNFYADGDGFYAVGCLMESPAKNTKYGVKLNKEMVTWQT